MRYTVACSVIDCVGMICATILSVYGQPWMALLILGGSAIGGMLICTDT
jgi:hypothetical protein